MNQESKLLKSVTTLESSLTEIFGANRAKNIMITIFSKEFLSKKLDDNAGSDTISMILEYICKEKSIEITNNEPNEPYTPTGSYKYIGPIVRGTNPVGMPYKSRGSQNKSLTGEMEKNGNFTIKKYEKILIGNMKIAKVTFNSDENQFGLTNYYPMDRNIVKSMFPVTYEFIYRILDHIEHYQ